MKINGKKIKRAAGILILSCLTLSSCSDWFEGKVRMTGDSAGASGLGELFIPTEEISSLDTPEQLFATQGQYSGTIVVSWKPVDNATSYILERTVVTPNPNGTYTIPESADEWNTLSWTTVSNYISITSDEAEKGIWRTYSDTIIANPGSSSEEYSYRYYYRVMAENISAGLNSNYTCPLTEDTEGLGWLFPAPSNVEATKGNSEDPDSIKITWNEVENASQYKIYYSSEENGTYNLLDTSKTIYGNKTSYSYPVSESNKGKEFYFKVVAVTKSGEVSAFSSQAMGYALQSGAPVAPGTVYVDNGLGTSKSELTVKWESIGSVDGTLTYSVYRTSSTDSVYTLVKKGLDSGKTSFTDSSSNLKTGIYYYYYIQSVVVDSEGNTLKSSFSTSGPDSKTPAIGFLLSPPSKLEAIDIEDDSSRIKLVWSEAIGNGMISSPFTYNIYYCDSTDKDGTYTQLADKTGISGTEYSDGMLYEIVEKKNFYKITTVNASGVDTESILSSAVAPVPAAPKNVTASKTKNLAAEYPDKWAPNTNEVYPVLITWEKPDSLPVPSAYYVYRSSSPDSGFRKITEDPVTEMKYVDENSTAKAGIFYYYKVYSLNSLYQGNKSNDPLTDPSFEGCTNVKTSMGYGAITRAQWLREYNGDIVTSQAKMEKMHKSDTSALGNETKYADIPVSGKSIKGGVGNLYYTADMSLAITMLYTDYADHYINNDSSLGIYYILNGNTNTVINSMTSKGGHMADTNYAYHFQPYNGLFQGMYPGWINYDNLTIVSGSAGGGYYTIETYELDYDGTSAGTLILSGDTVDWRIGEECRK